MKICVFCGSKDGAKDSFLKAAKDLGSWIASHKHDLVYGGANVGLMGAIADACLKESGNVIGILPEVLKQYEVAHPDLTEFHWVKDMHTRKAMMESLSDFFVALPGGVGTLEEFFEQLTWKQIGIHTKPVVLFNVDGFYDPLITFMQNVERMGFLREGDVQNLHIVNSIDDFDSLMTRLAIPLVE
jgi:uncharacterized protein (TIGR00730 family)